MDDMREERYNARRHYAASLRGALSGGDVNGYLMWLCSVPPAFLVHLIDWPTCHMDATDSTHTIDGELVVVWECSNCGQEHEEVNGAYEFCPHCGAEVVGHG